MSLEGYKPLDLSFMTFNPQQMQLKAPVNTGSIAQQILANTSWDLKPPTSLDSSGNPMKKQKTMMSRLMDLLSIGNYASADASLGALQAHQSSNSDNPLEDLAKSYLGAFKGSYKGIGAGLKGAFGFNDAANDPTNKNHYGDVYLQATEAGRKAKDPNSDMSLEDRKSIMMKAYISAIPMDILADPTNLIGSGLFTAGTKAAKGIKAGEEAANAVQAVGDATKFGKPLDTTAINTTANTSKAPVGSLIDATLPTPASVHPNTFDPETFDFMTQTAKLPFAADNIAHEGIKAPEGIIPPVETPAIPKIASKLADPNRRAAIAGTMMRDAMQQGTWDAVKTKLAKSFPGLDLTQTNKYLDHLATNPHSITGLTANAKNRPRFVSAIDRVLESDFKAAGRMHEADIPAIAPRVMNVGQPTKAHDIIEAIKNGSTVAAQAAAPVSEIVAKTGLKTKDLQIANDVIKHYKGQIETGMFPGAMNPDHLAEAISKGKTVKWSGPKQVNMWNTILNKIPFSGPAKYDKALQILRHAEDSFMGAGHVPYSAAKSTEAVQLRLSDVIAKIGTKIFAKHGDYATTLLRSALAGGEMSSAAKKAAAMLPDANAAIQGAIEEVRAGSAISDASSVKRGVDEGATAATQAQNAGLSEPRVAEATTLAAKTASDIAKMAGASPVGSKLASTIIKQMFEKSDPVESAISRSAFNTKIALSTGKLGKYSNVVPVTKAIAKAADLPAPHTLAAVIGPSNRAVDWLGARFNAAYKNADLRPFYLQEAATARSSIAKRAAVWNDAVKQFGRDPEMWGRAFKTAQGAYHAPVGSPEAQLSNLIRANIENLVGSSGLRHGAEYENTVAGRAQLLMPELNANLKRYGMGREFSNGKAVKDATGAARDFSNGTDWLKSWETWDVKDPLSFMMRMQNAVENTVREAGIFDEIATRWGGQRASGFITKIDHPRLSGLYFSASDAEQVKTFMKNLEELKKPNSKLMSQFDNVLSKWKSSVTIYMPSHHIRNAIGDTYMNWLAGVNSVKPYSTAIKVMKSQKGRYSEIDTLGQLTSPDAVIKAMQRYKTGEQAGESGTNVALTMKNGKKITNDMLYTSAFQRGLLPSARVLEDLADDAMTLDKFRPLGGKGQAAFQHLAEYREHFIRLAHYVDVLKKSPKDFPGAIEDAARAVRKWHPDGMDMTTFERNVMRRVFPFYSWTRKALPLMVESLVMKPGKVAVYPKLMGGLSEGLTGGQGTSDPFPEDQLFPDWIKEKGIGPIFGTAGNYGILNPSNPTLDLAAQFTHPTKGIGQMLNPAARIPAELLTNTEMSTGAPINSMPDYITKQLPGISTVGRVTNIGIGGPTAKWDKQGGMNINALINLLTASGKLDTGPYQKQAQFDLRDFLKNSGG